MFAPDAAIRMSKEPNIYPAILHGDRLEWLGEAPSAGDGAHVEVVVTNALPAGITGREALALLDQLGPDGAFADIGDPVAWQREQRAERDLPR